VPAALLLSEALQTLETNRPIETQRQPSTGACRRWPLRSGADGGNAVCAVRRPPCAVRGPPSARPTAGNPAGSLAESPGSSLALCLEPRESARGVRRGGRAVCWPSPSSPRNYVNDPRGALPRVYCCWFSRLEPRESGACTIPGPSRVRPTPVPAASLAEGSVVGGHRVWSPTEANGVCLRCGGALCCPRPSQRENRRPVPRGIFG